MPELMKVLGSGDKSNVPAAAYVLGRIGPDAVAALPTLRGLLASDNVLAGETSAWALTQIRPGSAEIAAEAVPVLIKALSSKMPAVRPGSRQGVGRARSAGRKRQDALNRVAAGDEDPAVKAAAAKALPLVRGGAAAHE